MFFSDGSRRVEVKKMDGFWVAVNVASGAEMFMHQAKPQVTKYLKDLAFRKE